MGRGDIDAEMVVIGEGPGKAEDLCGSAFVGPAGQLQNEVIQITIRKLKIPSPRIFFTNLLCCRPVDENGNNRPPKLDEIWACWHRLRDTIEIIQPKFIVLAGKVPAEHCAELPFQTYNLWHPSFVNRSGGKAGPRWRTYARQWKQLFEKEMRRGSI